jgi:hypothetical protein
MEGHAGRRARREGVVRAQMEGYIRVSRAELSEDRQVYVRLTEFGAVKGRSMRVRRGSDSHNIHNEKQEFSSPFLNA